MGPEERGQFSLERFFRWRCWWDYSTGLSGDLLTHEYDAVNQIMHLGIPDSATSSGGVYFFKDGRSVPDVLQTTFEWPDRNLTMLYSATLASSRDRGKVFMGHDASMEVSNILSITADRYTILYICTGAEQNRCSYFRNRTLLRATRTSLYLCRRQALRYYSPSYEGVA